MAYCAYDYAGEHDDKQEEEQEQASQEEEEEQASQPTQTQVSNAPLHQSCLGGSAAVMYHGQAGWYKCQRADKPGSVIYKRAPELQLYSKKMAGQH